jgi:hypothetical protein
VNRVAELEALERVHQALPVGFLEEIVLKDPVHEESGTPRAEQPDDASTVQRVVVRNENDLFAVRARLARAGPCHSVAFIDGARLLEARG